MTVAVTIPSLGESVIEVKVSRMIVATGTLVPQDAELIEIETDKLNQVLYAPVSGVVRFQVAVGDVLKIGDQVASIEPAVYKKQEPPAPQPSQVFQGGEKAVRKSSEEWLESKTAPTPIAAAKEVRKPMSALRKAIATRLLEAKNNTAMLTTFNEVDMTQVMEIRERYKDVFMKKYGVKLGFMSFFVKACVSALQAYPTVNAYIDGDDLVYRNSVDMSIAVSTDKGLLVPVIRSCEHLHYFEIEKQIEMYAAKARDGKIAMEDLRGGGFTITNGGVFGSLLSTPIINPPQCAILGMHAIQKRAIVIHDEIVIRPMMYLALSYDHRIIDGKEAVSFLVHIKNCIEDPDRQLIGI